MSELREASSSSSRFAGSKFERLPQSAEDLRIGNAAGLSLQSGMGQESQVIGAFVGIIRKHGFGRTREKTLATGFIEPRQRHRENGGKLDVLLSKFGMLESTLAVTRNPRLQRSLPAEADRGRANSEMKQLLISYANHPS